MKFTAAILSATLALAASLSARDRHILPSRPVCHGAVEVVDPRTFDRLYHNDHARIENVTCRGHNLHVFISYRGGEQPHAFRLLSKRPTWWYRNFAPQPERRRPYPDYRPVLYLSHDANGERGGQRLQAELVFDLRPLRRWPGPIPMRLDVPQTRKAPAIDLIFK
jgi:hypothetical protein|tara:strand:- start:176 stop:670 length:495 start_codon:yes stop_codon:yes gene_type:complete